MYKRVVATACDLKDSFFSRHPPDKFTEYEDELLYTSQRFTEMTSTWLPRFVSLQEWAERRIPPELASSINGCGIVFIQPDGTYAKPGASETDDAVLRFPKRRRTHDHVAQNALRKKNADAPRARKEHPSVHMKRDKQDENKKAGTYCTFLPEEEVLCDTILQVLKKVESRG